VKEGGGKNRYADVRARTGVEERRTRRILESERNQKESDCFLMSSWEEIAERVSREQPTRGKINGGGDMDMKKKTTVKQEHPYALPRD